MVRVVEPVPVTGCAGPVLSEKPGFEGLDFRDYVDALDDTEGPSTSWSSTAGPATPASTGRSRAWPPTASSSSTTSTASATARRSPPHPSRRGGVDPRPHPGAPLPHPDRPGEAAWLSDAPLAWLLPALRAAFLVAVVVFAWLGLRGRFDESATHSRDTSAAGVAAALALVLLGLARHRAALAAPDVRAWVSRLPSRPGLATFFVGQLGKYIPGLGLVDRRPGRRWPPAHAVPARATVAAGLVFLGYHLVTGVVVGTARRPARRARRAVAGLAVAARAGRLGARAVPAGRPRAGQRVAGRLRIGWADTGCRGPDGGRLDGVRRGDGAALTRPALVDLVAYGGAFALAYAVGVVIVLAPAGVGAREALFVLLLTPLTRSPPRPHSPCSRASCTPPRTG